MSGKIVSEVILSLFQVVVNGRIDKRSRGRDLHFAKQERKKNQTY